MGKLENELRTDRTCLEILLHPKVTKALIRRNEC